MVALHTMKNVALKIGKETIHPGESLSLALALPELFSCAPLYMPIKVIHGKQAGACLLVTAGMHGNELNGTEIINRLLNLASLKRLHGTIIAVPVLNVYGMINRSRYLPGGIELDKCFPGSQTGTHAARLAYLFATEIFEKANYCIDIRTGSINYTNLPQIYCNFEDKEAKKLAEIFGAPVISNTPVLKGSLRSLAKEKKVPFLLYEAGEAMRFDDHAIRVGLRGIVRVMRKLEMLPEHPSNKKEKPLKTFVTEGNLWVHASTSGISHSKVKLGQHIKKGEVLSIIRDPFGAGDSVKVISPTEGIIVGKNNLPLVHEGEALFQLSFFSEMEKAATHLEDWKEKSVEHFKKNGDGT